METLTATAIPPLPDFNTVLPQAKLLNDYYALYMHYFYGAPLPANFPSSVVNQFPNKSYKQQLKNAIAAQTIIVNGYMNIQYEYLADYHVLYTNFANGVPLPANFPQSILDQFPNKNFQQQLKSAIVTLQNQINEEKTIV